MAETGTITDVIERGFPDCAMARTRGPSRHAGNRASLLGHPCEEYLRLSRVAGDKRRPIDPGLAGIFQTGNEVHQFGWKILMEIGERSGAFDVVSRETGFTWDAYQITGTVDGLMVDRNTRQPIAGFDIKSVGAKFGSLRTVADLMAWKYSRGWIAQANTYMLLTGLENYFLILIEKNNLYRARAIPLTLDYEAGEMLIKKASRVNAAIQNGTRCAKINRAEECLSCDLAHICLPELDVSAAKDIQDGEVLAARQTMAGMKPQWTEYERCRRVVKECTDGVLGVCMPEEAGCIRNITIGDEQLSFQGSKRTTKPTEGKTSYYWRELKPAQGEDEHGETAL